jgi:hypothetical protein
LTQLTNYGENKLADFVRGQGLATLPANWYIAALSAYTDSSATEITTIGLSRVSKARSLANFAGTQGDGTTLASNGTTHTTSQNNSVALGTATGSATLTAVGLFDAASSGNCWMVFEFSDPVSISASDVITLPAGQIKFSLGLAGGMTDYLANKLIDLIFRAQEYTFPTTLYFGLFTAAPSNAGGGTEVGGGVGYSRSALVPSLSTLSGTQSAGSTTASSGTGGRIGNNSLITFPQPTGSWGTVGWAGVFDASSGGNLLFHHALSSPSSIGASSPPPSFAPNAFGITFA